MKKTLLRIVFLFSLPCFLLAQTFGDDVTEMLDRAAFAEETDWDSVFSDAEDVDAVVSEEQEKGLATTLHVADHAIPLRLSGSLSSSLGVGVIREDGSSKGTGYFDFYNYVYLYARPDTYLTVRATMLTSYPGGSWLSFQELFFDYLLLDHVYITAGKKGTTWGYTRLFSTDFDVSKKTEDLIGFSTNILDDSIDGVSAIVRVPLWTGTITGVALYQGTGSELDMENLSYALSVEMTVLRTSVNLFGRKNPSRESSIIASNIIAYKPHIAGIEAKRTFFGTDVYAQGLVQFESIRALKRVITSFDKNVFSQCMLTAGLYRWWDMFDPNIGFNVEVQGEYVPSSGDIFKRIYFDVGAKRIGPRKNITVGAGWNHDFNTRTGYVRPGVSVSGIFPHADWDTGLKIEYGDSAAYTSPKYTFGTYIKIAFSY